MNFEEFRSERRSFFCPNKLWAELEKRKIYISASQFIKEAIIEKMAKEEPIKKQFYELLIDN